MHTQQVAKRFSIPLRTVRAVMVEPVELLRQRYKEAMRVASSGASPWLGDRHPIGTPMIGDYTAPEESYLDFMWRFSPRQVAKIVNVEAEDGIKRHPTYERYISWRRMGAKPPPAHVYETSRGVWQCSSRRRLLVAQELGVSLEAWVGRHNKETGNPLKYGDIINALSDDGATP
jgi:hypothetical protein